MEREAAVCITAVPTLFESAKTVLTLFAAEEQDCTRVKSVRRLNWGELHLTVFPQGKPRARGSFTTKRKKKIMKTITNVTHAVFALFAFACFAFLRETQAACLDGCNNGLFNVWQGDDALLNDTTGAGNSAFGWRALFSNTAASFSTAVGGGALVLNNGSSNTAVGAAALLLNTMGTLNTAVGTAALELNGIGSYNTAIGANALFNNSGSGPGFTTGSENTAVGESALFSNIYGSNNTAIGVNALFNNVGAGFPSFLGSENTAVGNGALSSNTIGILNTAIGFGAGTNITSANNVICIGSNVPGTNVDGTTYIAGIFGVTTQLAATPVVIDSNGQFGTVSSSRRFKKEVKPMDQTSEAILSLKPVTFQYKADKTGTPQFGLIAEEVAEVNPNLVVRGKDGEIYTVRYDAVNAMLLNEFLKEHSKVEKLEATVSSLAATVKEQAEQIQKVTAQLALTASTPKTAANNPPNASRTRARASGGRVFHLSGSNVKRRS